MSATSTLNQYQTVTILSAIVEYTFTVLLKILQSQSATFYVFPQFSS